MPFFPAAAFSRKTAGGGGGTGVRAAGNTGGGGDVIGVGCMKAIIYFYPSRILGKEITLG